jgi:hypothetical protein
MLFLDRDAGDWKVSARVRLQKSPVNQRPAKLMHRHGNPNGDVGETSRRNAAMQMMAGSRDDLAL